MVTATPETRRQSPRAVLWALCLLGPIWSYATLLTGGFIVHIGAWQISSRNPRNPLVLSVASGLLAWWLSRRDGRDEGAALWRWCRTNVPVVLVAGVTYELMVFFRPIWAGFLGYPLAEPDVFTPPPPLKRFALPLLLVAGIGVLSAAAWKGTTLFARPRRTLAAMFLLGLALHFAMLGSLKQGLAFFSERAITSGHADFFHHAITIEDMGATLENYESYVRPYLYVSVKGPGVLLLFRGLSIVANSAPVRPLLAPIAPAEAFVRPWVIERGVAAESPILDQKVDEMRHLLALMFVLYPVLTLLPMLFVFWVGKTFVDQAFGLIAAMTFVLTPEAHLSFAHLDFSLFPLLAIATASLFVVGMRQQRFLYVAASALVFVAYFSITLAAVSTVMMLVAYVGLDTLLRLRRRERVGVVVTDTARALGLFGLVAGLLLTVLYFGIHFHPIERYSYARLVQRDWVTSEYNFFWVMANVLGYFLSFGLVQTGFLLVQMGRSAWRTVIARADGIDLMAIAWLFLVVTLLAFGRQHGETNRLWTFLTPVGCLVVARYIYDVMPLRRWWLPMLVFFVSLIAMRYRFNYY